MIKIISDSSSLYTITEGNKVGLDISPLSVTINNKTYKEYEEISTEEFIDIINEGHVPISSQPAIGEVVELYEKNAGHEIINISMANGLSGTYNTACAAKALVENFNDIEVINTRTLCGPQRYLVDVALELVKKQYTKNEIIKELNTLMDTSKSFLIPNDFDYLVRGGRLSPLVGKIGTAIKLVPVMTLSEDSTRLVKFTTKRTLSKAILKIVDELNTIGVDKSYKIYISHACKEELALEAKEIILSKIDNIDIEIKKLGPVFTTQGGPGCIAIQIIKKHKELN